MKFKLLGNFNLPWSDHKIDNSIGKMTDNQYLSDPPLLQINLYNESIQPDPVLQINLNPLQLNTFNEIEPKINPISTQLELTLQIDQQWNSRFVEPASPPSVGLNLNPNIDQAESIQQFDSNYHLDNIQFGVALQVSPEPNLNPPISGITNQNFNSIMVEPSQSINLEVYPVKSTPFESIQQPTILDNNSNFIRFEPPQPVLASTLPEPTQQAVTPAYTPPQININLEMLSSNPGQLDFNPVSFQAELPPPPTPMPVHDIGNNLIGHRDPLLNQIQPMNNLMNGGMPLQVHGSLAYDARENLFAQLTIGNILLPPPELHQG